MMNFEWDENKNRSNIRKHGIDFADVYFVFVRVISARKALRHERKQFEQALRNRLG